MKKQFILSVFILLVGSITGFAQPFVACFTLDTKRGCAPLTVNATNCSLDPAAPTYYYDFVNSPATFTNITTFTYPNPGKYVIRQGVNNGLAIPFKAIVYTTDTVEVLGKPIPLFNVEICAASIIHVRITDTNYDSYTLDYGDGTIVTAAKGAYTTYSYATLTPKTISVKGNYIQCAGATATKIITPITSLTTPDIIDLTVLNQAATTGSINLKFNGLIDRLYKIDYKINNGAYLPYDTITTATAGIQTVLINNLATQTSTYTFRIQNIDVCGNSSANSSEIASIVLSPTVLNGSNQITFNSNGGLVFNNLALNRNTTVLQNNPTSPYNDNAVFCGTDYCYALVGTLPTTTVSGVNHKSYSVSTCIKASYSGIAPVITNINSTVEGGLVKVLWDLPLLNVAVPSVSFYTIFREDGGSYFNYGSSNYNAYVDNVVNTDLQPYCYEVSYKDACNNTSLISLNTCTVNLRLTRTNEINNLTWTSYTGYQSGIKEYVVENLDENGNVVLSKTALNPNSHSEVADPSLAQLIYRIKVVPNGSENLISYSNTVRIDLTPQVFLPTIFTPNGDGENDILEIKGKYFKSAKITILNKWGEVVFISDNASIGWDGNYKGQPASVDSYGYHVVAFDNSGKEISLKGVVSLVR